MQIEINGFKDDGIAMHFAKRSRGSERVDWEGVGYCSCSELSIHVIFMLTEV